MPRRRQVPSLLALVRRMLAALSITPHSSACADTADPQQCQRWAAAGECDANAGYMRTECAESCGLCPGTVKAVVGVGGGASLSASSCANENDQMCRLWARKGECEENPGYMKTACAESCFACQSSRCSDAHADCAAWAKAGECSSNEAFMVEGCAFSCRACWLVRRLGSNPSAPTGPQRPTGSRAHLSRSVRTPHKRASESAARRRWRWRGAWTSPSSGCWPRLGSRACCTATRGSSTLSASSPRKRRRR